MQQTLWVVFKHTKFMSQYVVVIVLIFHSKRLCVVSKYQEIFKEKHRVYVISIMISVIPMKLQFV